MSYSNAAVPFPCASVFTGPKSRAISTAVTPSRLAELPACPTLYPNGVSSGIALGTFNAEVIEKVGSMIGKMTYGVSKEAAVENYDKALKLNPDSAIARTEMADGLYKLFGDKKMKDVEKLYAEAAACEPKDAMECLDIEAAKAEME